MPIYEYKCKKCSTIFDKLVKINDNTIIMCPECKSETKKLISSAGLVFKGSGFYITDYVKNKNSKNSDSNKMKKETTVKKAVG